MPTATSSMHMDPELAAASQKTAERGIRVLSTLLDNPITKRNCAAIYAASSGKKANADADLAKVRISNTNGDANVTIVIRSAALHPSLNARSTGPSSFAIINTERSSWKILRVYLKSTFPSYTVVNDDTSVTCAIV